MRKKIAKVIDLSYLQLALIFIILVLLRELEILSPPFNYELFAYTLPLLAIPALLAARSSQARSLKGALPILLAAFLFALSVRLFPHTHSTVPLGYDPGLYKHTMELYASALPQIPEADLAGWVKEMMPQGLPVLSDTLHVVAGADALEFMNFLFPFLGAFLVFPVFVVTRGLFGQRAGLVAAVLYAVSYTQFDVFTMFYFKNVLGLMFLLFSIYALEKKRYGLMAVMFAALGIFHRPEFLLFALILIPYFILHRRKGIVFAALGAAALIALFWIPRWEANWAVLSGTIETAITNIETGEALGGGTFFDFATYRAVSLAYLPFTLIGAMYLALRRDWNSIFFYFVISSIIVLFQLFFFKRFIIPLDIAFVILAAVGIECTLLRRGGMVKVAAVIIVLLLIAVAGMPTVDGTRSAKPLITEQQLEAVQWIAENTEEDAYILATSYDAPWVLGWSQRRVIAPGLFEWSAHGEKEWAEFLKAGDLETAERFLDAYQPPIYIYHSQNQGNYLNLRKFQNPLFQEAYREGAVVYRYLGGG